MILLRLLCVIAIGLVQLACAAGAEAVETKTVALAGELTDKATWRAYVARFVSSTGRVIDTANGDISHSEGQGYGMLLAVAAGDRATFERLWGWTRANLAVRDDRLLAWRWEPAQRPAVADMNNASDGDILVAWALTEAAESWGDPAYRLAARRIAVEVGRKLILPRTAHGPILLPGVAGFAAEDRPDGPVVNLSYWIFPAFERLPLVAPEFDWNGLSRNGVSLIRQSQLGPAHLPSEWTSLAAPNARPADGFPARFAHNAIRIPLYLVWAGLADGPTPFGALWDKRDERGLPIVDIASGRPVEWLGEAGYGAIAALTECVERGRAMPVGVRNVRVASDQYYAATLHLLTLVAVHMRYPQCLGS